MMGKIITCALAAWHSGHRVRLQNRRSRVRNPPGCIHTYIAVLLSKLNIHCYCAYLRKINASIYNS
jgi:hypothetical protein